MVKHIPMASDLRKNCANNSNLHSPIKQQISRKPPTHRIPPTSLLNDRKKKETSATAKVEESRPKNLANMRPLSAPNSDDKDERLQVYPFVEEPVVFNFGRGGYGNHLFLELLKEISYERCDYGRRLRLGGGVGKMKHSREDIYEFSSEADMMASFVKDNLF